MEHWRAAFDTVCRRVERQYAERVSEHYITDNNKDGIMKNKTPRRYKPVDRSTQGAAQSGAPNVPKTVDAETVPVVELTQSPLSAPAKDKDTRMILTLKGYNKKNTDAIYEGASVPVRFSLRAFPGKTAPQMIEIADGVLEQPKPKAEPKPKLTKEERAEARKNAPKPTAAERIARAEARLAKLREAATNDAGL